MTFEISERTNIWFAKKLHTKSNFKGMSVNYSLNFKKYKKMCIGIIS